MRSPWLVVPLALAFVAATPPPPVTVPLLPQHGSKISGTATLAHRLVKPPVVDASGLAPSDRVTALTLATLLARTAQEKVGPLFVGALPRVGIEGTVRWRRVRDALGRARAKSGHIEHVNALTGYVQTRRHGRVAFAIVVNDRRADDGPVDLGINRALDILARS